MFRYTVEILPYHDFPLEDSLRELADHGFKEVNLWSQGPPGQVRYEALRADRVRQDPGRDAGAD